jgi:hypothetical protein
VRRLLGRLRREPDVHPREPRLAHDLHRVTREGRAQGGPGGAQEARRTGMQWWGSNSVFGPPDTLLTD